MNGLVLAIRQKWCGIWYRHHPYKADSRYESWQDGWLYEAWQECGRCGHVKVQMAIYR